MRCPPHAESGYILVVKHPHYAVADDAGNFVLESVPPGKYTLRVWHEKFEQVPRSQLAKSKDGHLSQDVPVEVTKKGQVEKRFALAGDGTIAERKKSGLAGLGVSRLTAQAPGPTPRPSRHQAHRASRLRGIAPGQTRSRRRPRPPAPVPLPSPRSERGSP